MRSYFLSLLLLLLCLDSITSIIDQVDKSAVKVAGYHVPLTDRGVIVFANHYIKLTIVRTFAVIR